MSVLGGGKSRVYSLRRLLDNYGTSLHQKTFVSLEHSPKTWDPCKLRTQKQVTEFKGFWCSLSKTYYYPLLPLQPEASERIVWETIPLKPKRRCFHTAPNKDAVPEDEGESSGARLPPTAHCSALRGCRSGGCGESASAQPGRGEKTLFELWRGHNRIYKLNVAGGLQSINSRCKRC